MKAQDHTNYFERMAERNQEKRYCKRGVPLERVQ